MSRLFTDFLPEVLPYVRDCPPDVAANAVRNACIEFCEETQWLTQTQSITLLPNITAYDIDYDRTMVPIRMVSAKIGGVDQSGLTFDPTTYQVGLPYTPSERVFNGLVIVVAYKPARGSVSIDDSVYERWAEGIAHGARARLYEVPAQPFSDAQRALYSRALFKSAKADGRAEVNRRGTSGPIHVKHRRS